MWIVEFVDSGTDMILALHVLIPTLSWKRLCTCYSSIQVVLKLLYIFEVT